MKRLNDLIIPEPLQEILQKEKDKFNALFSKENNPEKKEKMMEDFNYRQTEIIENYYTKNIEPSLNNPASSLPTPSENEILNMRYKKAVKTIFISMGVPTPDEAEALQKLRESFAANCPNSLEEALGRVETIFGYQIFKE